MSHVDQKAADHSAPFRNVPGESFGEAVSRVAEIGRDRLLDWWARFRHYTHPHTFGHSGCEFAEAVAYHLNRGDEPNGNTIASLSRYDYAVIAALRQIRKDALTQPARGTLAAALLLVLAGCTTQVDAQRCHSARADVEAGEACLADAACAAQFDSVVFRMTIDDAREDVARYCEVQS